MSISFGAKAVVMAAASAVSGEFDFSTLGLTCDLDGRAGITVTGAGVSDWQDQGTANKDAAQTVDADRPANGGDVLGKNALIFDDANTEYLDWNHNMAAAGTIFVVGQVGAAPNNNGDSILGSGANNVTSPGVEIRHHTNTEINMRISDGTSRLSAGNITLGAGANFIIGIRWDGSSFGVRVNGNTEQSSGHSLGSLGTTAFDIGKTQGSSAHWDGEITRILCAPSSRLNDTDFATAFTQLNNIYGAF